MSTSARKHPSHSRGFTLIELMITLLVAGILLGVGVPSFRRMMAVNRVTTQANDLVGAIRYARSEAITRNTNVTLCRAATGASTTCSTSTAAWNFWMLRNAAGTVLRRGNINTYNGALQVTSDLASNSVTFGSDGLARTGGAVVNNSAFIVCTNFSDVDNMRRLELGASSRLSTTKESGTCP